MSPRGHQTRRTKAERDARWQTIMAVIFRLAEERQPFTAADVKEQTPQGPGDLALYVAACHEAERVGVIQKSEDERGRSWLTRSGRPVRIWIGALPPA